LTLGGNVSLAAGPVGRNAEAAGAASLRSVAGIFSYSKTKGLFAGVSLEGSAIIERRDANEKMYGTRYTAQQLLTGSVRAPPQAAPLMNILNSRSFSGMRGGVGDDAMYNETPVYDENHDDVVWNGRRGSAYGEGAQPREREDSFGAPKRSTTWQDDVYDRPSSGFNAPSRSNTFAHGNNSNDDYVYRDNPGPTTEKKVGPGRPAAPKPNFAAKQALLKKNEAVAVFNFDADQPGDLGFKKGDVITIVKRTDSDNDWWYVSLCARCWTQ
jgi:hypothetical protein